MTTTSTSHYRTTQKIPEAQRQQEDMQHVKEDAARFELFLTEKVSTMATSVRLEPEEVWDILQNIHVEMVSELKSALKVLEGKLHTLKRVDSDKLSKEIEKFIAAVSLATDLETKNIVHILSTNPGASISQVSHHLHEKAREHRFVHS